MCGGAGGGNVAKSKMEEAGGARRAGSADTGRYSTVVIPPSLLGVSGTRRRCTGSVESTGGGAGSVCVQRTSATTTPQKEDAHSPGTTANSRVPNMRPRFRLRGRGSYPFARRRRGSSRRAAQRRRGVPQPPTPPVRWLSVGASTVKCRRKIECHGCADGGARGSGC